MALTLPSAPKNFYDPSLLELKTVLEATNGSTTGTLSLITAVPTDIEAAWAEVGAGNHTIDPQSNYGTLVVGSGPIGTISGVVVGPEEATGENGYKLQFGAIPEVKIYIDGTTTTTAVVIGACLLVGRDTFAGGSDADLRYIMPIDNLLVADGNIVSFKPFEIIINYSTLLA